MIVQIAGKPKDYVLESIKSHIGRLDEFKDLEVVSKSFSEPKVLENEKDMFICFSEVEILVPSFARVLDIVFDFMPSSIEVLDPGKIEMNVFEATNFLNNLSGRLHRYDDIAKLAYARIRQLSDEIQKKEEQKKVIKDNKKKKK